MTDDEAGIPEPTADRPDESNHEAEADDEGSTRIPINPVVLESLIPFRDLQRSIASIDFGAIRAAQEATAEVAAHLTDMVGLQDSMRGFLDRSIDFSAVADLQRNFSGLTGADIAHQQQELAAGLAKSLNLDALQQAQKAFVDSQIPAFAETQRAMAEAVARSYQAIVKALETVDYSRLVDELDRWLPLNLRGTSLEEVARIALDEGLPLSWVPRKSIVQELTEAASAEDRLDLLDTHRQDILNDCLEATADVPHHWARECEGAVRAMQNGFDGPAQSHAANIIDSIVLCTLGPRGRDVAKDRATEDFDELGLRVAGEALVLRPLNRALTTWWPSNGTPPPNHFARHATAHGVGHPGLFEQRYALVAVMLAASLTVEFWDDPESIAGLIRPAPDSPESSAS